ncbi:DUF2802 domain-containing protein [Alkalilimnicola ehrlichii]|uniref:DUF2802 domain-containing protein n=1 Tax=Alkalilimnicola ehrlichii TaxID=351052 RepID=UPI00216233EB|nr:DUF2802 domain-containing protein [Alkalilimnicola ehrlichii]
MLALGVLVGLLVAIWAIRLSRRLQAVQAQVASLERTLQQNAECYQGLSAGAVGQGQHLVRVRQDLGRLKERIEQVANSDPNGSSFNQAIRMARKGASSEEIMEACGISQVEADLVLLLHRDEAGQ